MKHIVWKKHSKDRRYYIGGSDARVIMGDDEPALIRLWQEKRGEVEPEDLSGNLIVQLGLATEELNRRWYEANTGKVLIDLQQQVRHPTLRWMAATTHILCCSCGMHFSAAASSENDQGSMNLASNTASLP